MDYFSAAMSAISVIKEGIALYQQARGGLSESDQVKIDAELKAATDGLNAQRPQVDTALDEAASKL